MEEEGVDRGAVEPGQAALPTVPPPATDPVADGLKSAPAPSNTESRTRKKVTFDLDLQVHTIPKRIPIYERRPAVNTAYARPHQQPVSFVPRPLDFNGKDRYLLGATTTKKIIDLFSLPNGFPSYPMPPKTGARKGRPQGGSAQAVINTNNPYYTFANFRTSKISRAALNLKQITAALGEHFDSSVYNEWETSKRVQSSLPFATSSASKTTGAKSASSVVNELGVQQTRKAGGRNAIAAFSPSRLRVRPQQQPVSAVVQPQTERIPTPPRGHHGGYVDVPQSPTESWDRQKLPSVTTEQMYLNNRTLVSRRRSADSTAGSSRNGNTAEGGGNDVGPGRDRPSSRCSTIDTYVLSDIPGVKPSQNSSGIANTSVGLRELAGRRVANGTNQRPVAWEAGIAIPINEPVLNVSYSIRTTTGAPDSGGLVQWHVTSRPPNLSI